MLIADGKTLYDDVVAELPNLETACFRAVRIARDIIAEEAKSGNIPIGWSITIIDETGELVATMPFENTVTLH
ncbi:DUF6894 family protein [Sphingomonas glacialis]|nr:hypothetical protein [Sphingomonas glacialis]